MIIKLIVSLLSFAGVIYMLNWTTDRMLCLKYKDTWYCKHMELTTVLSFVISLIVFILNAFMWEGVE